MTMEFTKMHGLENDYIYINTFQERELPTRRSWRARSAIATAVLEATD